jgi:uncharacterized glyoxalase superfamily protein PhnB
VEDDVYERMEAGGLSVDEPYLICKDAERLIGFLQDAFGGFLLRRFDRPDGSLMHAEVGIDDGVVMIGGGTTEFHTAGTHKLVLHYRCREPARRDVRRYQKSLLSIIALAIFSPWAIRHRKRRIEHAPRAYRDVRKWHIALFGCDAEFGRYPGHSGHRSSNADQSRFMSTHLVRTNVVDIAVATCRPRAGNQPVSRLGTLVTMECQTVS